MNIFFLLPLVTSILYLQAGVFVFVLGKRLKPHLVFSLLSLAFASYAFGSAFYIASASLQQAAFWYRVATPGMRFYPFLTLLFFLSLAHGTPSRFIGFLSRLPILLFLCIPPLIMIVATFLSPDYFSGFRRLETGWVNESFPSSTLSLLYIFYLLGYFILSNIVLILQRRYTESIRVSRQTLVIQVFSIIMFILALFINTGLSFLIKGEGIPRLISSVPVVWLAGIVFTIYKHRLFLEWTDYNSRLLGNMEGLVLMTDMELRITSCTPEAARLIQTAPENLKGRFLRDVFLFSDSDKALLSSPANNSGSTITLPPQYSCSSIALTLMHFSERSGIPGFYLIKLQATEVKELMLKYRGLTSRELEVIDYLLQGKTNPQIADDLCISLATVKTHLFKAFKKLGVDNRYEIFSLISADKTQNHTIG